MRMKPNKELDPTSRTARHRGRFVCIGRPLLGCPEGTSENSPAFQRWVGRQKIASPEGTAEVRPHAHSFSRPFGTCVPCTVFPGVKTPGYSQEVPPGQRKTLGFLNDYYFVLRLAIAGATHFRGQR